MVANIILTMCVFWAWKAGLFEEIAACAIRSQRQARKVKKYVES